MKRKKVFGVTLVAATAAALFGSLAVIPAGHALFEPWKIEGRIINHASVHNGERLNLKYVGKWTINGVGNWVTQPPEIIPSIGNFELSDIAGMDVVYEVSDKYGNVAYVNMGTRQWTSGGKYTTCKVSRANDFKHDYDDIANFVDYSGAAHVSEDRDYKNPETDIYARKIDSSGNFTSQQILAESGFRCKVSQHTKPFNAQWQSTWTVWGIASGLLSK